MASANERKKDDCGNENLQRSMRRGKPQQQLYRPGSGPLRRSAHNAEETESDTAISLKQNYNKSSSVDRYVKQKSEGSSPREQTAEIDISKMENLNIKDDNKRKPKKPDQTFYVPKPVAQAQARDGVSASKSIDNLSQANVDNKSVSGKSELVNGNLDGSMEHLNTINTKSKRYSNRRRPSDTFDTQERNWRANSPITNQRRDIRQGSEPRAISHQSNNSLWNRSVRDTRSVEPSVGPQRNYGGEKYYMKPPSGRRHSTIGLEPDKRQKNLDALPPRLRKKFLEDSKIINANYAGTQYEGTWDGNSVVFQGSNSHGPQHKYLLKQNYSLQGGVPIDVHQQSLNIHNTHHQHHMPNNYQNMYYTLPHRGRGRARFQHDYENPSIGGLYRCVTPDRMIIGSPCSSRPPTPPPFSYRTRSNENLHRPDSRPQTPVQFYRSDKHDKVPNNERYDRFSREKTSSQKGNNNHNRGASNREKRFPNKNTRNIPEEEGDGFHKQKSPPVPEFHESLETQLSPVSPPTPMEPEPEAEPTINLVPVDSNILDWSEEVELQVKLEAEALSDAVTRSSSMASLIETSTASQPPTRKRNKKKSKRSKKRSGSRIREGSVDNQHPPSQYPSKSNQDDRKNSYSSTDLNRDHFKVPEGRARRRKDSRDRNYDRSRNVSRESSFDRSHIEPENWREEILRSRHNSERESSREPEYKEMERKKGGIIVLPQRETEKAKSPGVNVEQPKYPDMRKSASPGQQQKILFDPNNPNKPIIVKSSSARVNPPGFTETSEGSPPQLHQYITDQFGNVIPRWYDEKSEGWRICRCTTLLKDVKKADYDLQNISKSGLIFRDWASVVPLRRFLTESLKYLLCKDLKFCQSENVEQHFWKILYHNIIEMTRIAIQNDAANKKQYKEFILWLIDDGTKYFESLLDFLEQTHKFRLNDYLGYNNLVPQKGLGYIGLALISAQKIFLFLGDLGRYKEEVNETSNYGKCRQWYIKAHEINPKNGKPYNQLAVLALCAQRRKLDAVYYYMRSYMSSNPVSTAKQNLFSLFEENRKKYEQGERKRREERLEKARQHMKEKESESSGPPGSLRREIWIRPDDGRRVHRTTSAIQEPKHADSEEEDLAALSCLEVNKRFVTSYLHVHGKLITKIGMESFQEAALQMLKEFRALLQHSPMPLNCNRFLQLLALNMFAIESTQLKESQFKDLKGYRSELQERALVISLQMFNLILERCVSLLHDHIKSNPEKKTSDFTVNTLPQDFHMLLPAVKTWTDWLLCHCSVWNPPPSTQDYRVGPPGDAWSRLASLMNLLEKLDRTISFSFIEETRDGYDQIRLPEDAVLSGFTPLMYNELEAKYAPKDIDQELAQFALRIERVHFFGTVFLCGLEPPVLKLEIDNDFSEYISVVSTSSNRDSSPSPPELMNDDDLLVESFSEDEGEEQPTPVNENASSEVRQLLSRKVELEKRQRTQELHRQRVQKILQQSVVSVHIEIRPRILVPDTNCFIGYLGMIKTIVNVHVYTLMVPLVVLNELEGLGRGGKFPAPTPRAVSNPEHVLEVADLAKQALEYLGNRHNNIKCVTTKGTTLPTFTFTVEEDSLADSAMTNDDKILATCLTLCKNSKEQTGEGKKGDEECPPRPGNAKDATGEPRKLHRDVVLLTEDRNLRVKALARDLPVRKLPDFLQWAGLG